MATFRADSPLHQIRVVNFSENTIFQTNKMESRHFEKWSTLIPNFALGATCIGRYVGQMFVGCFIKKRRLQNAEVMQKTFKQFVAS